MSRMELTELSLRLDKAVNDLSSLDQKVSKMEDRVEGVEQDLIVHDLNLKRFLDVDWPKVESGLVSCNQKLDQLLQDRIKDNGKVDLVDQANHLKREALEGRVKVVENLAKEQGKLNWKLYGMSAGASGMMVAALELVKLLMGS